VSLVILAVVLASLPVGAMAWIKWRFKPARLNANADRLLADAESRMDKRTDEELIALVENDAWLSGPVRESRAAGEVRAGLKRKHYAALHVHWTSLWPTLLAADKRKPEQQPRALAAIIEIGAALSVLAKRHPR